MVQTQIGIVQDYDYSFSPFCGALQDGDESRHIRFGGGISRGILGKIEEKADQGLVTGEDLSDPLPVQPALPRSEEKGRSGSGNSRRNI